MQLETWTVLSWKSWVWIPSREKLFMCVLYLYLRHIIHVLPEIFWMRFCHWLCVFVENNFFSFGATAPILALTYLHETLRFTSVYPILDSRQVSLDGWSARRNASTCTQTQKNAHTHTHTHQTSIPWVGFEPTIPASERAKIVHTWDRSATVTGIDNNTLA
jgi:hypothetical protein